MTFELKHSKIEIKNAQQGIAAIEVSLIVENCKSGTVNTTDIMLQGGPITTIWAGHPSEQRWSLDW